MEQLTIIETSFNNYNKENNDNVKVDIFSDKFENNIINIEKNYSWDNKIVKINLKLSTVNINKIYCKVRINDLYITKIEELYKQKYFEHNKYKIIIKEFIDKNNQVHKNIESIIFQDNILNVFINFNTMINNLNSNITDKPDKHQQSVKNNTPLLPYIESHIKTAIDLVINKTKTKVIEENIPITTDIATDITTDIATDITTDIATDIATTTEIDESSNDNSNNASSLENELNSKQENEIIQNVEMKLKLETTPTPIVELENKLTAHPETLQPYFNHPPMGMNPNMHPYMIMHPQTYGYGNVPMQHQTLFNQITPATLDAEYNHIMMLENHIKMWQHHLEILKKTHEINIKCYNEKVDIQQKTIQ